MGGSVMSYSIGRKINEIRLLKKVSQDEIANNLGISRQRFSRIESGQSDVSY
ncbi:MAG: helix-turn-helix transcriptional regulator, partial [Lachnospiraceae bacterium]|nr:helix-turn-helix transcriptional regulator [Lachnospiraceae bacterium]